MTFRVIALVSVALALAAASNAQEVPPPAPPPGGGGGSSPNSAITDLSTFVAIPVIVITCSSHRDH
jgi:hypothetical protein